MLVATMRSRFGQRDTGVNFGSYDGTDFLYNKMSIYMLFLFKDEYLYAVFIYFTHIRSIFIRL